MPRITDAAKIILCFGDSPCELLYFGVSVYLKFGKGAILIGTITKAQAVSTDVASFQNITGLNGPLRMGFGITGSCLIHFELTPPVSSPVEHASGLRSMGTVRPPLGCAAKA
jgi:hypothetical protein